MTKRWLFSILAILLILSLMSIPSAIAAEGKIEMEPIKFMHPEYLSGGAWLAFTGNDPSLGLEIRVEGDSDPRKSPPESGLQAVGGAAAALIPYRSPAVKFSRNILISRDLGHLPYQTEPHISVNPKDPSHIVVAMIDYNFPGVANYVSIDGGATWDGPFQPKIPRGEYYGAGDPVVAFDRDGNVYVTQLTVSIEEFVVGGVSSYAFVLSTVVNYSADGGFTWDGTVVASPGTVYTRDYPTAEGERARGDVTTYSTDKPWLTVGPNPNNPGQDILYLTYTLFIESYTLVWLDELPALEYVQERSVIEMVRSDDGGRTWSYPVLASPVTRVGLSVDESGQVTPGRLVHGSQPIVASDGTLHVAYWDSTDDGPWEGVGEIWVATSTNKGQTFSQSHKAATFLELDIYPRSASFRLWGASFPQLAIGPDDELYIAYAAYPEDNTMDGGDVFMVSSLDGGQTWAAPVTVNDDDSGRFQFYTSITVDPAGTLHMMWGDTRDDPTELAYHIYYSSSEDQGKTWEFNSRVSDYPSNPNYAFPRGAFIGDYFSIKATADDVYMVWPDSRLGEILGNNQKIAFARKTLMPAPSIFLSPPSGSAGRDIIIQGNNFQPESEIFIQVGGVLTATGFTSENGTFALTIFAPISGEGARDIIVSDISGNAAVASFFTEFGFDTFRQSITDIETGFDAFQQNIGNIETRLDTLQQSIEGLETVPEEGFSWLSAILAGALVIALATAGALWYRQRTVSQS